MTALLTVCVALAAMPAFAQKKTKAPKTTPAATTAAAPVAPKVSGMVKKPGVADGKFTIAGLGKKYKGNWVVDGSKASIADKKGGTVMLTDITPGSNVSVEGTIDATAKSIMADKITANYIPKKKATTTAPVTTTTTTKKKGKKTKGGTAPTTAPAPTGTAGGK